MQNLEESSKEDPLKDPASCEEVGSDDVSDDSQIAQELSENQAIPQEIWEAQITALKEQHLRTLADTENFRKRLLREKEEAVSYANQNILLDMAELLDNLERALASFPFDNASKEAQVFYKGVEIAYKSLLDSLEKKYSFKGFAQQNDEFDPYQHEALMNEVVKIEEDQEVKSVVKEVFQRGYLFKEKILRTAKVKIQTFQKQDLVNESFVEENLEKGE